MRKLNDLYQSSMENKNDENFEFGDNERGDVQLP